MFTIGIAGGTGSGKTTVVKKIRGSDSATNLQLPYLHQGSKDHTFRAQGSHNPGRDVKKVLERYEKTVKPMHLQFIEPWKRYADIIVPQDGMNEVAISILLNTIEKKLNL